MVLICLGDMSNCETKGDNKKKKGTIWLTSISIAILLVAVFLFLPAPPPPLPPPPPQTQQLKQLELVLTWPPTMALINDPADTHHFARKIKAFRIHGIWQTDQDGKLVVNEDGDAFCCQKMKNNEVKDLWASMKKNPYGTKSADSHHWSHQWNKHGKGFEIPQEEYFGLGVKFMKMKTEGYSGLTLEKLADFIDSKFMLGQPTRLPDLETALQQFHGVLPIVICVQVESKYVVSEVIFCLDISGEKFVDCVIGSHSNLRPCSAHNVVFPTFL